MEIKISTDDLRKKKLFVATPCYGGQCLGHRCLGGRGGGGRRLDGLLAATRNCGQGQSRYNAGNGQRRATQTGGVHVMLQWFSLAGRWLRTGP